MHGDILQPIALCCLDHKHQTLDVILEKHHIVWVTELRDAVCVSRAIQAGRPVLQLCAKCSMSRICKY